MTITHAIVPAAGYGTRLRPLTHAIPKEMLPLGRKPVLEHVLEELQAAGVVHVLFVVSPGKEMISRYFGDGSAWGVSCDYVMQPEMKGLGDAILRAEEWAAGRAALVAFGDCVIDVPDTMGAACPSSRLMDAFNLHGADAAVLTQRISREKSSKYGILKPAGSPVLDRPFGVDDIVEKPAPADAPSDFAVAGRWILGPKIYGLLRRTSPAASGELNLTDAIRLGLDDGLRVWAEPLRDGEMRRDIGGWETYLTAAAEFAVRDEEFGPSVRRNVCGS